MKSSGFSLIEVLVALTILSVGVLAYLGAVASVSRALNRGVVRLRVAEMVQGAMEGARRSGCAGAGSGTVTRPPVTVRWQTSRVGSGADIEVVALWSTAAVVHSDTFRSAAPCI